MGIETERKFLIRHDGWKHAAGAGVLYVQAYLSTDPDRTVRVRIAGDDAFLTVKGRPAADAPLSRAEFEYSIPLPDARAMLETLCLPGAIRKTRYRVPHGAHIFEVDVFDGDNAGLVLAEVELQDADETVSLPDWAGEEVSADSRYANAALSKNPFKNW